jgi:predicted protein tyrosine phosphatase
MNQLTIFPINFPYKYWHLISIYGDDEKYLIPKTVESLKKYGLKNHLSLNFWDITNEHYDNLKIKFPNVKLFCKKHAQKVIEFLDILKNDPNDSILAIHCSAGISRSGAVGTFACDYLGLDYNTFLKDNPYIMANPYVLRILRNCAGLTHCTNDGIDRSGNNLEDLKIDEIWIPKATKATV